MRYEYSISFYCFHLIIHYFISRVIMGAMASQITSRFCNHLFGRRWKKTSKLRVTGLSEGNSPVTDEFPAQRVSNAENVSIWWRHHIRSVMQWTSEQKRIVLLENAALPGIYFTNSSFVHNCIDFLCSNVDINEPNVPKYRMMAWIGSVL